jgi:hypothetical protein
VKYLLIIEVEKESTNEVTDDAWVPNATDVADEIRHAMLRKDLDTGWVITNVEAPAR